MSDPPLIVVLTPSSLIAPPVASMLPPLWKDVVPEESRSTAAPVPLALICTPLSTVVPVVELEPMRMAPALPLPLAWDWISPGPFTVRAAALEGATVMAPLVPLPVDSVLSWDPAARSSKPVFTVMAAPSPEPLVLTLPVPVRTTLAPSRLMEPPLLVPVLVVLSVPAMVVVLELLTAKPSPLVWMVLVEPMEVLPAELLARKRSAVPAAPVREKEKLKFWRSSPLEPVASRSRAVPETICQGALAGFREKLLALIPAAWIVRLRSIVGI